MSRNFPPGHPSMWVDLAHHMRNQKVAMDWEGLTELPTDMVKQIDDIIERLMVHPNTPRSEILAKRTIILHIVHEEVDQVGYRRDENALFELVNLVETIMTVRYWMKPKDQE